MIRLKEKTKSKKKINPYYLLVYHYMIGDANGNTSEKVRVDVNNPFLERYCILLNKLRPVPGRWGVMLEQDQIADHVKDGQITEEEGEFLKKCMFDDCDYDEVEIKKTLGENYKAAYEFQDGVKGETEYSFLVFEGIDLYYVDEYGEKHETEIV